MNFLLVRLGSTDLASGRCQNAMDMPGWQMESGQGHLRQQRRSQGRLLGGRGSRTEAGGGDGASRTVAARRVCWAEGSRFSCSTSRSLNPERTLGRWRQCERAQQGCGTDTETPPSCLEAQHCWGALRVGGAQPGAPGVGGASYCRKDPVKVAQKPHLGPKCPVWLQMNPTQF